MVQILKPPAPLPTEKGIPSLFLAGSIDMGQAENWQEKMERELSSLNCLILNPRRDEWNAEWVQSIDNAPFREQVEWELAAQEHAEIIAMYFAPSTRAPITLLELGLFAQSGKVVVCCPEGFWRKGNVDIVCKRFQVPMVNDLPDLVKWLSGKLGEKENVSST